MKKAQTWSTDALVAVFIFLFIAIAIMFIAGNLVESKKFEQLSAEGELISEGITSPKVPEVPGFIEGTKLNKEKLEEFTNTSYNDLKSLLGLSSDFCIHIEDDEGYLINVTENITGVGSPKAKVSGVRCTTKS